VAATTEETILWACVSLYKKFQIDGKTELLFNQDLRVLTNQVENHPDKRIIDELRRKAQAEIRSGIPIKKNWQGLVKIFQEHFGENLYPDLPGEIPPRGSLSVITSNVPGSFVSDTSEELYDI